jgi:hypothetical protein
MFYVAVWFNHLDSNQKIACKNGYHNEEVSNTNYVEVYTIILVTVTTTTTIIIISLIIVLIYWNIHLLQGTDDLYDLFVHPYCTKLKFVHCYSV